MDLTGLYQQLPNEPFVERTKRQGHRKTLSLNGFDKPKHNRTSSVNSIIFSDFNSLDLQEPKGYKLHSFNQKYLLLTSNAFPNTVFFDENADRQDQIVTTCSWSNCQLELHSQEALVKHILQDHVGTGKPSYVCHWKGCTRDLKPFSKRHKIQNHVRIHTGERPFCCPVADCGKRFSRQDGLNTHIKVGSQDIYCLDIHSILPLSSRYSLHSRKSC